MNLEEKNDFMILRDSLADRYCRLLLITGDSKEKAVFWNQILDTDNQMCIGKELVNSLCNLPFAQRTKSVIDLFNRIGEGTETLFLSEIEILFDRLLSLDPIKLLKSAARNRSIIVNWPGKIDFNSNSLSYATPGHSEYFCTKMTEDILFFDESGRNSANKTTQRD